jgi:hypothetical protein
VYAFGWPPGEATDHEITEAHVLDRIRRGSGVRDLPVRMERIGSVRFAAKLADTFRGGPVFLAGDAAHRVSPRGGTGMNTAIQSAVDLGWKLAWVVRGWADDALLDTYESERRPVAAHNVERSSDRDGSIRPVLDELLVDLGGRVPHAWVHDGTRTVSTIDLLGAGFTLFTGPDPRPWQRVAATAHTGVPVTVQPLPPITARAVGVRGPGALLVRPDGAPAAAWADVVDRDQLQAALRSVQRLPRRRAAA